MLKISQIIDADLILFPMLRNVALFFITNYRKEIMKNSSLSKGHYFFLPFSIPEPALISASQQYLMVPCGLILSSASSSFPKGSILKISKKKTCEALDLAKRTLKMTPDRQFPSKHL